MAAKFEVVIEVGDAQSDALAEREILDVLANAVSQGRVTGYQIKRSTLREVVLPEYHSYATGGNAGPDFANVRWIGSTGPTAPKKDGDAA